MTVMGGVTEGHEHKSYKNSGVTALYLTLPYPTSRVTWPFYVSIPTDIIINLLIISASVEDGTEYWFRLVRVGNLHEF